MANRLDHPPPSPALPAEGREESGKLFCTESLADSRHIEQARFMKTTARRRSSPASPHTSRRNLAEDAHDEEFG